MEYQLTQAAFDDITEPEAVWGTTKYLPTMEQIPDSFKHPKVNDYIRIADAMFVGEPAPSKELVFNPGFEATPDMVKKMQRFLMAHMRSFEPKHEHKIAGVAFMISKIVTVL